MTSRVVVLSWINEFMVLPFFFFSPLSYFLRLRVRKRRRTSGECPPPDSDPFNDVQLSKQLARFVNLKRTKILKPKLPFAESAARSGSKSASALQTALNFH